MSKTCQDCKFFHNSKRNGEEHLGSCYYYPPTPVYNSICSNVFRPLMGGHEPACALCQPREEETKEGSNV